jgi:pantothenate kinase
MREELKVKNAQLQLLSFLNECRDFVEVD